MRGEDDVAESTKVGLERFALTLGLDREDVDRGTGDVARFDVLAQGDCVDGDAAREVEEERTRLHQLEFVVAEQAGVSRTSVDVQGHDIGDDEQRLKRRATGRVAEREFVIGVVEIDLEAEGFGDDRQLAADVAVADDAEAATADFVAAGGRFVPDAGVHVSILFGQSAGQ